MMRDPSLPGRPHVVHTCDEFSNANNYLVTYNAWLPGAIIIDTNPNGNGMPPEVECYDYSWWGGQLETFNAAKMYPAPYEQAYNPVLTVQLADQFYHDALNELRAPLPAP